MRSYLIRHSTVVLTGGAGEGLLPEGPPIARTPLTVTTGYVLKPVLCFMEIRQLEDWNKTGARPCSPRPHCTA